MWDTDETLLCSYQILLPSQILLWWLPEFHEYFKFHVSCTCNMNANMYNNFACFKAWDTFYDSIGVILQLEGFFLLFCFCLAWYIFRFTHKAHFKCCVVFMVWKHQSYCPHSPVAGDFSDFRFLLHQQCCSECFCTCLQVCSVQGFLGVLFLEGKLLPYITHSYSLQKLENYWKQWCKSPLDLSTVWVLCFMNQLWLSDFFS